MARDRMARSPASTPATKSSTVPVSEASDCMSGFDARAQLGQDFLGRIRNKSSGAKHGGCAVVFQEIVVLGRDDAADDDQDVRTADFGQFLDQVAQEGGL